MEGREAEKGNGKEKGTTVSGSDDLVVRARSVRLLIFDAVLNALLTMVVSYPRLGKNVLQNRRLNLVKTFLWEHALRALSATLIGMRLQT